MGLTIEPRGVRLSDSAQRPVTPAVAAVDLPEGAGDGFEIFLSGPGVGGSVYTLVLQDGQYVLRLEPVIVN